MKHDSTTHRIDLTSAQRFDPRLSRSVCVGEALMTYEGQSIGSSRQPLYAAARYLLDNGLAAPSDRVATFRGDTPSLSGIVGQAAKLSVEETDRDGLRLVAYRAFDRARLGGHSDRERADQKPPHCPVDGHMPAPLPI